MQFVKPQILKKWRIYTEGNGLGGGGGEGGGGEGGEGRGVRRRPKFKIHFTSIFEQSMLPRKQEFLE